MRSPDSPALVLVVDDNSDNLFVLENLLTHEGMRVKVARNGAEALSLAAEEIPDLVLLDLDMPVMDGWETSRRLRAMAGAARVPIMALTAHALLGDEERALTAAIDAYMTKPFSQCEVLAQIRQLLAKTLIEDAGL